MEPAVARLAALARAISTHDPRTRLLSNADGQVVHDGREVLRRLVAQLAAPVRWDLCMTSMADLGVTGLVEMPPAGTLTGIAKRNLKGVEVFALNTPDQLDEAMEFVQVIRPGGSWSPLERASSFAPKTSNLKRSCRVTAPSGWSRTSVTRCRSVHHMAALSWSG
jgi:[acyl-carrier-protein] S-malonyltransferase